MRALPLIATLLAMACTVSLSVEARLYTKPTTYVRATEPPPPLREDAAPGQPPTRGAVWVEGHWAWNGRWVWTPGAWKEPREGHVWEPPVCVAVEGDYRFYPGYFRPVTEPPPPVYREPGHIQLNTPAPSIRPSVELPDRVVIRPGEPPPATTGPELVRPEVVRPELDGPSVVAPGTDVTTPIGPGVEPTTPDVTPTAPTLRCELPIARVPRSTRRFGIAGEGFDEQVVVQVAGTVQAVRSVSPTSIQAETDRAGEVVLVRGQERAVCGRLELF
ncbi:MAG: hypothetical protein KF901_29180 [Myxococcales bacterium]|nr:hypothetical protein [Myxococcales bacterium]